MIETGLAHYLRVLKRNLWIVLLVVAVVVAGTYYASLRQPKVFQAAADVFLSSQSAAAAFVNGASQTDPVRQAETDASLARTPIVARRALSLAGLSQRTPQELLANSSVTASPNADILTFSVRDHDAAIASRLATSYANAYARYRHHLDTASVSKALRDVDRRLSELQQSGLDKTAAYADLLDKQQQMSTVQLLGVSNPLLVPAGAAAQIEPRPIRNGAIALVLGLILGLGAVLLRETLDTRVRTPAELQHRLDLPQLARIPEPARRYRRGDRLVMLDEPHSPSAEVFRILATNLDFVNLDRRAHTVMFTSATHSEGKSTTVANLAVAMARTGRRVILLDLDLRKPTVGRLFGLTEQPGLTSVALGRTDLEPALMQVSLRNASASAKQEPHAAGAGSLEVLPVGVPPPNPAEFAASQALGTIIGRLEARADIVLIDAPPLLNLSDAVTLTSRVDGLVVVAKLMIKRSMVQELHRVLASAPVSVLGFVATGASATDTYDGYGYGYGHSTHDFSVTRETANH